MKIVKVEDLHCDAGWRVTSFLKITTDDGIIGWSEYIEDYGGHGVTGVIHKLAERLIGQDPRPVEVITHSLYVTTRHATGGINQQAIAAIENALVDIKAKALGIPVYEMLGGPLRDRLELYWSHCGTYRVRHAKRFKEWTGAEAVRSLDDLAGLGREVAQRGFRALKTNPVCFDGDPAFIYKPSKDGSGAAGTEFNIGRGMVEAAVRQLNVLRKGAGPGVGLHLDIGFNHKTDGNLRIARALGFLRPCVARASTPSILRAWRSCGPPREPRLRRVNPSMAGASTGTSSRSKRSMWRSSTFSGTGSSSR